LDLDHYIDKIIQEKEPSNDIPLTVDVDPITQKPVGNNYSTPKTKPNDFNSHLSLSKSNLKMSGTMPQKSEQTP